MRSQLSLFRTLCCIFIITFTVLAAHAGTVENVSAVQANQLIQKNGSQIHIIDVRTPGEYAAGHIKGAMLINMMDSNFTEKMEKLPKDGSYLIYCRSGNRSGHAIEMIQHLNFSRIYHLHHGMNDWLRSGLPVEK